MASKSNTAQSFAKKISNSSAPYPKPYLKESSSNICDRNTQRMSFSSAHPDTPNNCHFDNNNQSTPKRWSTDSLDNEIKKLLHEKLVRQVVKGRPFETIQFHRRELIKQLADWIGVFDKEDAADNSLTDDNARFRHKLVSLLATASKQNVKDVPSDNSEWTKLLSKWLRANTSGAVIMSREIYQILAVDGFRGFKPKHLKCYLPDILLPLRKEYKSHVCGVRRMYEYFDKDERVSSLTGTDSACVVFMALIDWYTHYMKNDLMLDDQIRLQVQQVKSWAEGNLQQHVEYFRDIKNVDEKLLKKLSKIYAEEFKDAESWKTIGRELLINLNNDIY